MILHKAGLKCLNESVASITAVTIWKSNQRSDPLAKRLFQERSCIKHTRSETSNQIRPPVPGYPMLSSNIMSRIWNDIPMLQNATTLAAAKTISKNWAKRIPNEVTVHCS